MATFTEHYDLIKPGTDDYYDVADFNENMDAIDTQLYQAEQDMAGVSEKIGNPGDQGTDTIFGLLHPDNQPEEKADFYRFSKTDIKVHIQNWKQNAGGGRFYAKLTTFCPEKNGTVYVKINSSDKGSTSLGVYDKMPPDYVEAPDKTTFATNLGIPVEDDAWYHRKYNVAVNQVQTASMEMVIPVLAGISYTFMYFCDVSSESTLNEFILGYTDTQEA